MSVLTTSRLLIAHSIALVLCGCHQVVLEADCFEEAVIAKAEGRQCMNAATTTCSVTARRLHLRASPSTKSKVIATLLASETLDWDGTRKLLPNSDYVWYCVRTEHGTYGWVADSFIKCHTGAPPWITKSSALGILLAALVGMILAICFEPGLRFLAWSYAPLLVILVVVVALGEPPVHGPAEPQDSLYPFMKPILKDYALRTRAPLLDSPSGEGGVVALLAEGAVVVIDGTRDGAYVPVQVLQQPGMRGWLHIHNLSPTLTFRSILRFLGRGRSMQQWLSSIALNIIAGIVLDIFARRLSHRTGVGDEAIAFVLAVSILKDLWWYGFRRDTLGTAIGGLTFYVLLFAEALQSAIGEWLIVRMARRDHP